MYRRYIDVGVLTGTEHKNARKAILDMNMTELATVLEQKFDVFKRSVSAMNDQELGQALLKGTSETIFKNIQMKLSQFLEV